MRGRRGWAAAMRNRMCGSRRRPVEERLTRPQRLDRQLSDVDYKKLRKLILSRKLAPCFDALEAEDSRDLEECPICFFYYPSLNRSACCSKGICTECFLQMKPSDATRPAQCPYCKAPCYAVEYHGARTEKEKGLEQAEEQKVIEARIRMQWECDNVEQVISMDQPWSLEVHSPIPHWGGQSSGPNDGGNIANSGVALMGGCFEANYSSIPDTCSTRHEEFSVELGEVMMMEVIWQSLQDARLQKRTINQTTGSSNRVGAKNRARRLCNDGRFLAYYGHGENSSSNLLAEHSILHQQPSERDHDNCQRDQDQPRDSSSGTESESECSVHSFSRDEDIISEPCEQGCSRSINTPSTSNPSIGSGVCSSDNAGQNCSQISDVIRTAAQLCLLRNQRRSVSIHARQVSCLEF